MSIDDDFTGTNGDAPDADLWEVGDFTNLPDIQSNALHCLSTSAITEGVSSTYQLSGDFDLQVDFSVTELGEDDTLMLSVEEAGGSYFRVGLNDIGFPIDRTYICEENDGSYSQVGTTGTSDSSGKFRLTRTSGELEGFYWNSSWQSLGSVASWSSNDLIVTLFTSTTDVSVEGTFDNFVLNSGTVNLDDDFTGTDADPPGIFLWSTTSSDTVPEIESNKLLMTANGGGP